MNFHIIQSIYIYIGLSFDIILLLLVVSNAFALALSKKNAFVLVFFKKTKKNLLLTDTYS